MSRLLLYAYRLHRRLLLTRRRSHRPAPTGAACRQFHRRHGADHRLLSARAGARLRVGSQSRRQLPGHRRPQFPDRCGAGRHRAGRPQRGLDVCPPAAGARRLPRLHRRRALSAGLAARPDSADPDQPHASRTYRRGQRLGALLVDARLLPRLDQPVAARHAMAWRFGGGLRLRASGLLVGAVLLARRKISNFGYFPG